MVLYWWMWWVKSGLVSRRSGFSDPCAGRAHNQQLFWCSKKSPTFHVRRYKSLSYEVRSANVNKFGNLYVAHYKHRHWCAALNRWVFNSHLNSPSYVSEWWKVVGKLFIICIEVWGKLTWDPEIIKNSTVVSLERDSLGKLMDLPNFLTLSISWVSSLRMAYGPTCILFLQDWISTTPFGKETTFFCFVSFKRGRCLFSPAPFWKETRKTFQIHGTMTVKLQSPRRV